MTDVASAARRAMYCGSVSPPILTLSGRKVLMVIGVTTRPERIMAAAMS
jgi:hypothetical protein